MTDLTRRDAIVALGAAGVAVGGASLLSEPDDHSDDPPEPDETTTEEGLGDHELETALAVADVVYPSELDSIEPFVETFLRGRVADRPAWARELEDVVTYLDDYVAAWYEPTAFASLSETRREETLQRMGADTADPDPDGSNVARVRYYLVNDLLYALYASPTGGELVGIENPQGHPGGIDSYRRGPHR